MLRNRLKKMAAVTAAVAVAATSLSITAIPASATMNTPASTTCSMPNFPDNQPGSNFYNEIRWLQCSGFATGYKNGSFGVNKPISRNEAAAIMHRYAGEHSPIRAAKSFRDMPTSSPYYDAIAYMSSQGIINGHADGTWHGGENIQRSHFTKMVQGLTGAQWTMPSRSEFRDVTPNHSLHGPISWAHVNGIVSGYGNYTFGPSRSITRGEMAAMMYRMNSKGTSFQTSAPSGYGKDFAPPVTSSVGYTTTNVNLRSGPSTSYTSLGVVPKGEKITVYSTKSGNWTKVKTSRGTGWMSSTYISSKAPAPAPKPPAVKKARNLTHTSYSAAGMTSTYSVRADGIDYSKPVGALFYFDGDYYGKSASISENPSGAKFKALAAEANRRNLIFIAPITPSANTRTNGYTWWERVNPNGDWQRALASAYLKLYPAIDRSRIHSMGYSGGAEFISAELFKDRPENWMRRGSAIIVAGGGHFNGGFSNGPSSTFRKAVDMRWYAGSRDVAGQTNPPTWSALNAAREGSAAYRNAGYNARLITLDGVGHHDYVLHNIMAQHFNSIGVKRLR